MNDMVNHPPHYEPVPGIDFECIELTRDMTFDCGNAVKYMWRTDRKNGIEDIKKARWYINDAIENYDDVIIAIVSRDKGRRAAQRLQEVAKAQADPSRKWFFYALSRRDLAEALEALDSLLR